MQRSIPAASQADILLQGASLSGKSTICRNLQLLYGPGFSAIERQRFRDIIIDGLVDAFKGIRSELKLNSPPSEFCKAMVSTFSH